MTHPFTRPRYKLTLLLLVCMSVFGGALLLSHARYNTVPQNSEIPSSEHHDELPPVW
jgi:hypothetical protein